MKAQAPLPLSEAAAQGRERPFFPLSPGKTMLTTMADLAHVVTPDQLDTWKRQIHQGLSHGDEARLQIQLGEVELAGHEPVKAQARFRRAATLVSATSPDRGLARYDEAVSLYFQGRFKDSAHGFEAVLKSHLRGYDRKTAGLYARHAQACYGYHFQHAALGIPEPTFLDPLCGVAGLAVCLKARKIDAPKATLRAIVRHDGEGSSIGDVQKACAFFGLEGRVVTAQDDQGLMMLPKPLVAHVERDHFVALTRADKSGVSYVCSDCGPWPGGEVRLTWKQWHSMEADQLLVMTRPGSAESLALANLPTHPGEKAHAISLASLGSNNLGVVTAAARALSAMSLHVVGQGAAFLPLLGVICGERGQSLQCSCPIACPVSAGGPGAGGPGGGGSGGGYLHVGASYGDPVNLATGEEEYESGPDLTVYNPIGPSVVWSRTYDSLANTTPNGFGAGWSHPYNIRIEDNSATTGGGSPVGPSTPGQSGTSTQGSTNPVSPNPTSYIVLPDSAKISFTPVPSNPPTASSPVRHLTVQAGFPYLVDWCYDSVTGGKYFEVTLEDRTKWIFQDCTATSTKIGLEYVKQIQDRIGNPINLNWSSFNYNTPDPDTLGFTEPGLTSITDASGTALLTVNYGTNGRITSVADRYGRSVYYSVSSHSTSNVTCDDLDQVSTIVPTGAASPTVRYQFTYANSGNQDPLGSEQVPYLHTIAVPSPTGTGMATATIDYDVSGFVTDTVDANGNKVVYTGVPSSTGGTGTPGGGGTSTASMSPPTGSIPGTPNATRVKVEDPSGNVVFQYDKYFDNRMSETKMVNGLGQTVYTNSYADPNTPYGASSYTDGNGRTWTSTYDSFGHQLTSTTPKNVTTTNSYSYSTFSLGEMTAIQRGSKTTITYTHYEPSGLVETVNAPIPGQVGTGSTQTTTYNYDALGNCTSIVSPGNNATLAHTTTYGYTTDGTYTQPEAIGRPVTVTDSRGKVWHYRYDALGRVSSSTDPLGNQTTCTYNLADQPVATTYPATGNSGAGSSSVASNYLYVGGPATSSVSYDESGAPAREVDYTLGKEGEALSQSGSVATVACAYDAAYHLKTLTDGGSHATTYTYDLAGRAVKTSYPGASGTYTDQSQVSSFDAVGNPLQRIDGNGVTTNFTYGDGDGNLSSVSYPASPGLNVSVSYDSYDQPTSVTDATGTASASYDDLGNVVSRTRTYTGLPAQTFTYTFYPDGARETMSNAAGTWTYGYDADGRISSLTSPVGSTSWSYLDNGWLSQRALPNATTSYSYNALGLLTALTNSDGNGATLSNFNGFTYDNAFNSSGLAASIPVATSLSGNSSWQFDSKNRLTQEQGTWGGFTTQAYSYDAANNPTTFRNGSSTYNSDNQRTGSGLAYDGNGSPTTYGGVSFGYDPEGRLTSVGTTLQATYAADSLRASKTTWSGTTYFYYDAGEPVLETNSAGTVTAVNVFAPDGLVGRVGGGATYLYLFDPQGNVVHRISGTTTPTTIASSSRYDAYGAETAVGSTSDPFAWNGRWGYYLDRETGLYLCQHRYYDSGSGRWITRDPLGYGGGIGLYSYTGQHAVGGTDPSGLSEGADGYRDDDNGGLEPVPLPSTGDMSGDEGVDGWTYGGTEVNNTSLDNGLMSPGAYSGGYRMCRCAVQADDGAGSTNPPPPQLGAGKAFEKQVIIGLLHSGEDGIPIILRGSYAPNGEYAPRSIDTPWGIRIPDAYFLDSEGGIGGCLEIKASEAAAKAYSGSMQETKDDFIEETYGWQTHLFYPRNF